MIFLGVTLEDEAQIPSANGETDSTTSLAEIPDLQAQTGPPPSTDGEMDPTTSLTEILDREVQAEPSPSVVGFQSALIPGLSRRNFAFGSQALMHRTRFRHQRSCPHNYPGRTTLRRGFRFQG